MLYLLFVDISNEDCPAVLNVVYCRIVVMTGECHTALSPPQARGMVLLLLHKSKADIPLETGFAMATQRKLNQHKKHDMYMANARILRWDPAQPIFH